MNQLPPYLSKGDKVAIIATAKKIDKQSLKYSIKTLRSWGLIPIEGQHLYNSNGQFAGTDTERLHDLQWALDSSEIKAIFCARGGYGTTRILDVANFESLTKHPKWLIGYSDITSLHFVFQINNCSSIHGPMPVNFSKNEQYGSLNKLKEVLFGYNKGIIPISADPQNKTGVGSGFVTGGNLTLIYNMIGTKSDMDFSGKILFIEEVGEYLYHIDRVMTHLKRAEKLTNLQGLIVGHFSAIKDNEEAFGNNWKEIILDAVKDNHFPVAFNFPAGHEDHNDPIVLGTKATLTVNTEGSELNYFSLYNTSRTV